MVIDLRTLIQAFHNNERSFIDPRIRVLQTYKNTVSVAQHSLKLKLEDPLTLSILGEISYITVDIKKLKRGEIKTIRKTDKFELVCKEYEDITTCKILNIETPREIPLTQAYACWWLYFTLSGSTKKNLLGLIKEK